MTVQLLEETPAVLSLGKLCEDHWYSHGWVSGQKPRLNKEEKTIVCKTDNFVLLVVPGLSTSSGSNSSSTSKSHDLSTTSPAQERSDELAPREWCGSPSETQNKNKNRDGNRDADDRLRDLHELLEEFTESRGQRSARTRTHFSGLRFGTSFESGIKIKEAQYLYSLPERPACEPKCQGLLGKDNHVSQFHFKLN